MTLVSDDNHSGFGYSHKTCGIATIMSVNRFPAGRIDADELIDERRVSRERVAEKILANTQSQADDRPGVREKGSGLNPHVVSGQRNGAQGKYCDDQQTCDFHNWAPSFL